MAKRNNHNTGNTFRWIPDKNIYRATPYIIKTIDDKVQYSESAAEFAIEKNYMESNIPYSMNKKKRWILADQISDIITHHDHTEEDCKISISKCSKVSKQANCFEYRASMGYVREAIPKNTKYCDINNIIRPGAPKRHKLKGNKQSNDVSENNVQITQPEISYGFFYPTPSTSDVVYNPKLVDYSTNFYYPSEGKTNGKHNKNVVNVSEDDDIEENFLESKKFTDSSEIDEGSDYIYNNTSKMNILQEAFDNATIVRGKSKKISRRLKKKSEKNIAEFDPRKNALYICTSYSTFEDSGRSFANDYESSQLDSLHYDVVKRVDVAAEKIASDCMSDGEIATKLKPIRLIFDPHEVSHENLRKCFDTLYQDHEDKLGFTIDVTSHVHGQLKKIKHQEMTPSMLNLKSYLIFDYLNKYSDNYDVYSVIFISQLPLNSSRLETLFDYEICTVQEVLSATLYLIDTLPDL